MENIRERWMILNRDYDQEIQEMLDSENFLLTESHLQKLKSMQKELFEVEQEIFRKKEA
jgi:hypothetical protein